MRAELARIVSAAVRIRDVQLAGWAFRGVDAGDTIRSRRLFGYQVHVDVSRSVAHRLLYLMGERFIPERALLEGLVEPGMTVVDVGANIGYYLLLFERLLAGRGRVICIEPGSDNLVELRRNIAANGFTNAIVHDIAVGAQPGAARLRSGLNGAITEDAGEPIRVEPLDALVNERADVVKIDVEGYEAHVIDGSLTLLHRHRPVLFLEMHPGILRRFGRSASDVVETLRPVYSRMEAWEMDDPSSSSLFARMSARYFGPGRSLRRRALAEVLAESQAWSWDRTFWLVCRQAHD